MSVKKRLIKDLAFFSTLRYIMGAYQEVSLMKMRESRG